MKRYSESHNVALKWIYLEGGHGKGIPDGLGATIKRAIKDLLLYNPNSPIYTVTDLINHGIDNRLPSIKLHTYSSEDVEKEAAGLPIISEVPGIGKVHEISFVFVDGMQKGLSQRCINGRLS